MSNFNYLRNKKLKKVYRFKMAAILLIFVPRDCAIPRKLKNHFPEDEFQRNLAQRSILLIETHNWYKIWKIILLREKYPNGWPTWNREVLPQGLSVIVKFSSRNWVSPDHRTENQIDHICIAKWTNEKGLPFSGNDLAFRWR